MNILNINEGGKERKKNKKKSNGIRTYLVAGIQVSGDAVGLRRSNGNGVGPALAMSGFGQLSICCPADEVCRLADILGGNATLWNRV